MQHITQEMSQKERDLIVEKANQIIENVKSQTQKIYRESGKRPIRVLLTSDCIQTIDCYLVIQGKLSINCQDYIRRRFDLTVISHNSNYVSVEYP